jgi:hypothetical protein
MVLSGTSRAVVAARLPLFRAVSKCTASCGQVPRRAASTHSVLGSKFLTPAQRAEANIVAELQKSRVIYQELQQKHPPSYPLDATTSATATLASTTPRPEPAQPRHQESNATNNNTSSQSSFRQAIINATVTFATLVLAAQAVRNANLQKQYKIRVEALEEVLRKKHVWVQEELLSLQFSQLMAREIIQAAAEQPKSWFGAMSTTAQNDEELEDKIARIVQKSLLNKVAQQAQTSEEQAETRLRQVAQQEQSQPANVTSNDDEQALLLQLMQEGGLETPTAAKKKHVFTM